MKVTICQFPDDLQLAESTWQSLITHVKEVDSELVLLGEMPFYPWPAGSHTYDEQTWQASLQAHRDMESRFHELGDVVLASSRPVVIEGTNLHEAFVWDQDSGIQAAHHKYYLPEEPCFWEATWYRRGEKSFEPIQTRVGKIGFLMCTEMWFTEHARAYGAQGVQLLLCPRASGLSSRDKWLAGARAAAVMSGAYCLSGNRGGHSQQGFSWAGTGWVIDPDAEVLALTNETTPFQTVDIQLGKADAAKTTYPRYVAE